MFQSSVSEKAVLSRKSGRQIDDLICCRFEDYVGQLEAAAAVAGLSAEKEKAPSIKDRKELAAIQEVLFCSLLDGCIAKHDSHRATGSQTRSVTLLF